MKTPEEYYNSKSKEISGNIAGVCFLMIAVLIIIISFFTSCSDYDKKSYPLNYKQGDIIYLKPDSIKVMISSTGVYEHDNDYTGYYNNKQRVREVIWFQEYEIYPEKELKTNPNTKF